MFNLIAQEDREDYEVEIEAQKDMVAFMQYSAPFRFGVDLKVGDKVEYKLESGNTNQTIYSLEVIEETDEGIWIVEYFENNEIHFLYNLQSKKLIDIWGYDELGNKHEPDPLEDKEVNKRIQEMIDYAAFEKLPINFKEEESKILQYNHSQILCRFYYPADKLGNIVKSDERSAMVFSGEIPKMIPFQTSLTLLNSGKDFKHSNLGLVKYNILNLMSFKK